MGKPQQSGQSRDKAPTVEIAAICKRIQRAGLWKDAEPVRDTMMREARKSGMSKEDAQQWCYAELDRLYPSPPEPEPVDEPAPIVATTTTVNVDDITTPGNARLADHVDAAPLGEASPVEARSHAKDEGKVRGLDTIPPAWPTLPPAASLAAELGWVQSNRLVVVSESANSTRVDLSRAVEPAPSRSALAWLETSIRAYAKFTDTVARVLAGGTDEADEVRRERTQQHEIERLLMQMAGKV